MRKFLSLITALVLCTTMWGAEVIPAGEYAGTWYRHSISQLDGRATKATSVVVSAEESGKQTITFKGFKCGYQGDIAVDIPITVTTSNGSCTIAKDVEVGHTNATSGKMYIRTYSNYTSSVDPSSMIITLCTRYYYYDTDGETEKNQGTEYEYIQLNPADWTDWVAFPAADKNAATWTFSASNAFKSLIDESCDVTLMSRTAKENANHRQYKVCGFQMKSGSGKKVDLVFDENPSTKNITFGYAGLGFYESTAKQARAKMETGSFDAEKGIFTLNVKYVYANTWKAAVAETLAIHKEEPVEKKALYLKAGNVDYMKDNAVVYAYCWGGADEDEWSKFEYVEKETTAVTSIAEDRTGMKIVRFASGTTTPSWQGTIWNQTGDISVSSDFPEKVDMIELSAWDGATAATWSKYTAPTPTETKYYAKNNWNGAAADNWSWLEMSATNKEDIYMLDSVVFGGTGININTKEEDTDAFWFDVDHINVVLADDFEPINKKPEDTVYITPDPLTRVASHHLAAEEPQPLKLQVGDTIMLVFNAADTTLQAGIYGRPEQPQPVEVKYYITGNAALCGEKAWDAQAIEMIDSTHTFEAMAAGEYEMKITNGAWDPEGQSWGSAALSDACSAGVDNKDGNIHFIVETPNNVVVSIANGKVTVTGTFKESSVTAGIKVNVTVPDGTPACFFYGEMSGNTFAEMTKVDETHYTIDFPKATTIGWGYLFVWENGNWNTKNADPEGDIKVEPVEGVINVEIKAWVTAPGTEYKYTTYTEWQVKYGPAWEWVNMTAQEDGTFTVEAVWGNTGINIASGDNPIKQDWYPLDDAALTVEEGVVEGGNVVITLTVVDDETVALNVAKKVTTNISNVKGQAGQRYNILGQPVNETYRGFVIMNGQTFLQK